VIYMGMIEIIDTIVKGILIGNLISAILIFYLEHEKGRYGNATTLLILILTLIAVLLMYVFRL